MDEARRQLKDLGDRIQAAMDRHGITPAEICIRRFRWRMREAGHCYREVARAADAACLEIRQLSKGLLELRKP